MRTLYVATVYWRDNDVLFSVAGYDKATVKARTESLMDNAVKEEYDSRDAEDAEDAEDADTLDDVAGDLCWSGVHAWEESEAQEHGALGIPEENRKELEQDGITVY